MELQSLVVPLLLDSSKYEAGLDKSQQKTKSWETGILGGVGKVGGIVAAGAAIGFGAAIAWGDDAIDSNIEYASSVDAVTDATGMRNDEAATWILLGRENGVSDETLTKGLGFMAKGLVSVDGAAGPATKGLEALGISVYDNNGVMKDANTLNLEAADALAAMPDGAQKAAIGNAIYGKSWVDINDVMNQAADGGFDKVNDRMKELGLNIDPQQVIDYQKAQERLKQTMLAIQVAFGAKLIPVLTKFAEVMGKIFSDPKFLTFFAQVGDAVAGFAIKVIEKIPAIVEGFQNFATWLFNNQPIIIGVLAALGGAFLFWVYTSIAALLALSTTPPFLIVIGILVAIAALVALLAAVWKSDFGGIRTATLEAFSNIAAFWNGVLKPAFMQIWSFISTYILPIFMSIGKIVASGVVYHFKVLGALFTNVIVPALKAVWSWLGEKLGPTIEKVGKWISTKLTPAFAGLKGLLVEVAKWFANLADKMANLKLPAWLTPGSPFPFTYALQGMNKELQKSANAVLPQFAAQLSIGGNAPNLPSSQSTQQSANSELVSAIRGISRDPIDYDKLARVLRDTVLKEMK